MSSRLTITDPKMLRALAHPLRLDMLELLRSRGPSTVSELATELAESTANCSYHLRTLARYGFVEEAGAKAGRSRPWSAVPYSVAIDSNTASPSMLRAHEAVEAARGDQTLQLKERWRGNESAYPEEWQTAAFEVNSTMQLTAEELTSLGVEIHKLLSQFSDREAPKDARRVVLRSWGFPTDSPDLVKQARTRP